MLLSQLRKEQCQPGRTQKLLKIFGGNELVRTTRRRVVPLISIEGYSAVHKCDDRTLNMRLLQDHEQFYREYVVHWVKRGEFWGYEMDAVSDRGVGEGEEDANEGYTGVDCCEPVVLPREVPVREPVPGVGAHDAVLRWC